MELNENGLLITHDTLEIFYKISTVVGAVIFANKLINAVIGYPSNES